MRDANFNVLLEVVSLFLFFLFLAFFVVFAIAAMTIVGIETEDEIHTGLDAIVYTPRGYLLTFLVFTVPAVVVVLASVGIRVLLLRPESAPVAAAAKLQVTTRAAATSILNLARVSEGKEKGSRGDSSDPCRRFMASGQLLRSFFGPRPWPLPKRLRPSAHATTLPGSAEGGNSEPGSRDKPESFPDASRSRKARSTSS